LREESRTTRLEIRRFFSGKGRNSDEEIGLGNGLSNVTRNGDLLEEICRATEGNAWTQHTEDLLKPYEAQISSHLVAMVILQKPVAVAQRFFQWADQKVLLDFHAYHALLKKLGEFKRFSEMWSLLETMRRRRCEIGSTTLCIIMRAYGAAGMSHECLVVFSRAHQFGVDLDADLYTTLLGVLFKARMIDQAKFTFERMLQDIPDVDSSAWAIAIRGFGTNGCAREAEKCWDRMVDSGFKPKALHYNCLIEGFCESRSMNKALFALAAMQDEGLKPNAYTFNPILGALCKAGRFAEALNIFFGMRSFCAPNRATCNILLEGLFLNRDVDKACELFELMEEEGLVDNRSYFVLTSGLKKAKETEKLVSICKALIAKHGDAYDVILNTLLQCLCEGRDLDEAVGFFNGLKRPNVASYAMMINRYCKSGELDEAMELLADMDTRDCEPNAFCYTPLLGAVLRADRINDALRLFDEMVRRGIETNEITCGFLIRKLGLANRADDIVKVCGHVMDNSIAIKWQSLCPLIKNWRSTGRAEEAETLIRAMVRQGCISEQSSRELKASLETLKQPN
jgi:pentatricopeptide repeat protein